MTNLEEIFLQTTTKKMPETLYQPIEYILMQSGKRIRPRLVMLSTELFEGNPDQAIRIAAAFEMLHNFTLIHDDIMDQAPIRRGKETVYKKWNSNIAILSGDALANMALQQILLTDIASDVKLEVIDLFTQTSLLICEGQQYDLDFETSDAVSIADYITMIRYKTAVMLAACLKAGAMISHASEEDQELIYCFGIALGIAFQLKDDLLDVYADSALFGKKKGIDIQDNKKTYLYLKALEDANEAQRKELLTLFSTEQLDFNDKLAKVVHIYEALSIQEKTAALMQEYVQEALLKLDKISIPSEKKEELKKMTLQLCEREK